MFTTSHNPSRAFKGTLEVLGPFAGGTFATLCLALFAGNVSAAPKAEKAQEPPPPEMTWWLESEDSEIRGFSDGTRIEKRGENVEVRQDVRPSTLTTADGARYQATDEGRVIFLEDAGNSSRRSAMAENPHPVRTPGERTPAFASRPAPQVAAAVASNVDENEQDAVSSDVVGWGMQTVELLLKVFAIVLLLRLVFFWVDLSYSHAGVIRFSLAFVLIGEIAVRFLSTALWAG